MDDWESNNEVVASWGEAREKSRMEAWSHRVQLSTVYGTVTVPEVSVWCNIACQSFAKYKKDSANAAVHAAELHTPPSEEGHYRSITEPDDKLGCSAYKVRRLIHALKDNLTRPQ
ncbi:uncharacterized protein RSE6_08657 [Rhynchosporium secalis]|uniref:Uncharacterized protein n=1 Tax=Rhynchosporium secalis TaxID=38038 RepID=A0A1E1MG29_RHYSE|nr:uncharacterized protein RSE6_08657 [Rhynchosporium secalis]